MYRIVCDCDTNILFYTGPDDWATVAAPCGNNKQSPINIVTNKASADSRLTPVQFTDYQEKLNAVIVNNGHTGTFYLRTRKINKSHGEKNLNYYY